MTARFNLTFLGVFVGFALSASAQIDSFGLRAKYGPPLSRQTFIARPGIEMVVDYASNGHVCRIQLPPMGPEQANVQSTHAIDKFVEELVPAAIRGAEKGRLIEGFGLVSIAIATYENVSIAETSRGEERTGVTVTFTKEHCQGQSATQ